MNSGDLLVPLCAIVLVGLAGLFSAADAALSSFSRARADEMVREGRGAATWLRAFLADPRPHLNTALLLRVLCEVAAAVLVTLHLYRRMDGAWWPVVLTSTVVMVLVSYVVIGVAPRTLGRQHADGVALAAAGPLLVITKVLGPLQWLLILIGNAITPGRGFRQGPFSTETELRELVDLAEASSVIESGERKMIHSVFELGDTTVREVMVPRPDIVYIERHKNLRQARSLFLRSGFSRVPVVGDNLDDLVGFAYLKDVARRDFEDSRAELSETIDTVMRPVQFVPDSQSVAALLQEMQARRQHIAGVVDEYGGTAGIVTIEDLLEEIVGEITDEYDEDEIEVERLPEGPTRVSSRFPVDDLDELTGVELSEDDLEDVDTVGGLMAKHLGKVPIPGTWVEVGGLRFTAEEPTGRRNKVSTVLIGPGSTESPNNTDSTGDSETAEAAESAESAESADSGELHGPDRPDGTDGTGGTGAAESVEGQEAGPPVETQEPSGSAGTSSSDVETSQTSKPRAR